MENASTSTPRYRPAVPTKLKQIYDTQGKLKAPISKVLIPLLNFGWKPQFEFENAPPGGEDPNAVALVREDPFATEYIFAEFRSDAQRLKPKGAEKVINRYFFVAGMVMGVITYALYWAIFWSWATPECPAFQGRVCNDAGVCDVNGRCVCANARFNGESCEQSACPAYDPLTRNVCLNRGLCSPAMTFDDVPEPCRWINPTPTNPFPRNAGGWNSTACKNYLQTVDPLIQAANGNRQTLTQLAQQYNLNGIPQCVCNVRDYVGRTCDITGCPALSTNNEICAGRGLKFVDTFANLTTLTANGCQCQRTFSFLSPSFLATLTPQQRVVLSTQNNATELSLPACGELVTIGNYFYINKGGIDRFTTEFFRCYCEQDFTGIGCERGKCPFKNGLPCNGKGLPTIGYGLVSNTTRATNNGLACDVRCVSNTTRCFNKNACVPNDVPNVDVSLMCAVTEKVSASDAVKWRCAAGGLVGPQTGNTCALGFTYATLDPGAYEDLRNTVRCDLANPNDFLRCFPDVGDNNATVDGNLVTDVLLTPSGASLTTFYRNFDAPLVWFYFYVVNQQNTNATVTVVYDNTVVYTFAVDAAAKAELYAVVESNQSFVDFEAFRDTNLTLTPRLIDDKLQLYPFPYLDGVIPDNWKEFRIRSVSNDFSLVYGQALNTEFYTLTAGTNATIFISDNAALGVALSDVEASLCRFTPQVCVFVWDGTHFTYQGQRLCRVANNFFFDDACAPFSLSGLQAFSTRVVITVSYKQEITNFFPWIFQEKRRGDRTFNVTSSIPLLFTAAEYITQDLLLLPCACAPSNLFNQSYLDLVWSSQAERQRLLFAPGQHVVAPFSSYGQPKYKRSTVLGSGLEWTFVVNGVYGVLQIPTQQLRFITTSEFRNGLPDDDLNAFPARCPIGTGTTPAAFLNQRVDDCACVLTPGNLTCPSCACSCNLVRCDCQDPSLEQELFAKYVNLTNEACECLAQTSFGVIDSISFTGLDVSVPANQSQLFIEFQACFDIDSVVAIDTRFNAETVLATFNASCVSSSMQVTFSTLGTPFTRYIFINESYVDPNVAGSVHFGPAGFPLFDLTNLTYSASTNTQDASKAALYDNQFWISGNLWSATPQFIRIDLEQATNVTQILVVFVAGAIPLTPPVPVEVALEVKFNGTWTRNGTVVVTVDGTNGTTQATTFDLYGTVDALRLVSIYQFGVQLFVPYTETWCNCDAALNAQVVLNWPYPALGTNAVYDSLVARAAAVDASVPCVSIDQCFVQVPGITQLVNVTANGICDDVLGYTIPRGITVVETLQPQVWAIYSPPAWFAANSPNNATNITATSYSNGTFRWFVYCSIDAPPCPLTQTEADALFPEMYAALVVNNSYAVGDYVSAITLTGSTEVLGAGSSTVASDGTVTFVALITVAEYSAPVPTANLCPAGWDAFDCGTSNRIIAEAPRMYCNLTATQALIQEDIANSTLPSNYRGLNVYLENGATANVTFFVTRRNVVVLGSACTRQVCPTALRCPDGSCSDTCNTRYDCPGTGCVEVAIKDGNFQCYCKPGYADVDCSARNTYPAEFYNPRRAPVGYIHFFSVGSLQIQYPYFTSLRTLQQNTATNLLQDNRPYNPRIINCPAGATTFAQGCWTADVRMIKIRNKFGSGNFPYMFQRRLSNGETVYSDAAIAHYGPLGQILTLDMDAIYDPETGLVSDWTTYYDAQGNPVQYRWNTTLPGETQPRFELTYDELPIVCANGIQVALPSDCIVAEKTIPLCNGNGIYRPDGTCECAPGWTSFFINNLFTQQAIYPYGYDPRNQSPAPQIWNVLNLNSILFGPGWCTARDCTMQDCSPPTACFPGTPELQFKDRLIPCGATKPGWCGASLQECARGIDLEQERVCAGNGIPIRIDYKTPDDFFCACGKPLSPTANISDVTSTTELTENGFGGRACNEYFCTSGADTDMVFLKRNVVTGAVFTDNGVPIPGKWSGYCGAPIGPDPDELPLWRVCCSNPFLLQCEQQPCRVAGQVACIPPDQCQARGGTPLQYPCNNHGTALSDGTCACDQDQTTGTGYTADYNIFSSPNCYAAIRCGACPQNGNACCYEPNPYNQAAYVDFPNTRYLNGQVEALMTLAGFGFDNRTVAHVAGANFLVVQQQTVQAVAERAVQTQLSIVGLATCVCIYPPPDSCANPFAMNPFCGSTLVYQRAFRAPYLLPNNRSDVSNPDITNYPNETVSTPIEIRYNQSYQISTVRLWAASDVTSQVDVTNALGALLCPSFTISTNFGVWQWVEFFCVSVYQPYDFEEFNSAENLQNCGLAGSPLSVSRTCLQWKQNTCDNIGGTFLAPGSLDRLVGCTNGDCCVLAQVLSTSPTNTVRIVAAPNVRVQFVQVMGYGDTTVPVPDIMVQESTYRIGGPECATSPDTLYMLQAYGPDKDFYLPGDQVLQNCQGRLCSPFNSTQTPLVFDEAGAACIATGGVFGASNDVGLTGLAANPFMAQPLNALRATDSPSVIRNSYPAAFVSAKNVEFIPNATVNDFYPIDCLTLGDRFLTPQTTFPYEIYGSGTLDYSAKWYSAGTSAGWLQDLIDAGIAPFTEYMNSDSYQTLLLANAVGRGPQFLYDPWAAFAQQITARSKRNSLQSFPNTIFSPQYQVLYEPGPAVQTPFNGETRYVTQKIVQCRIFLFSDFFCDGRSATDPSVKKMEFVARLSPRNAYNSNFFTGPTADFDNNIGAFGTTLQQIGRNFFFWPDGTNTTAVPILGVSLLESVNCRLVVLGSNALVLSGPILFPGATVTSSDSINNPTVTKTGQEETFAYIQTVAAQQGRSSQCSAVMNFKVSRSIPVYASPLNLMYATNVRILSTIPWMFGYMKLGTYAYRPTAVPQEPDPTKYLQWVETPYMCQRYAFVLRKAYQPPTGQILFPALASSPMTFYRSDPACQGFFCFNSEAFPIGVRYVDTPSPFNVPANAFQSDFPLTPMAKLGVLSATSCASLGRDIPEAETCELVNRFDAQWIPNVYPITGTDFVKSQTVAIKTCNALTCFVQSVRIARGVTLRPILVATGEWALPGKNIIGTDGLMYLFRMAEAAQGETAWRVYASMNAGNFFERVVVPNCVAVFGSTVGQLFQYPCEYKLNYVCQYDYSKFTACPGCVCDKCGTSGRLGGFARTQTTCFQDFAQANRTNNPFGFAALQSYEDGTLYHFVGTQAVHFDDWMAYVMERNISIWQNIPGAVNRYLQGISTQPGKLSRGQTADPVSWINLNLQLLYPFNCGIRCSRRSGLCTRRIAVAEEFCDPDAPQLSARTIPVDELPTVLFPVNPDEDPRFIVKCGTAVRFGQYYVSDSFGDASTGFQNNFTIIQVDPLQLRVISDTLTVFNSVKNTNFFIFEVNATSYVAGELGYQCIECASPTALSVDVWVSPIGVTYAYPTQRVYIGTRFTVPVSGATAFSFSITVNSSTPVYQTVGFDIYDATENGVITVFNGVLSTDASLQRCASFQGTLPKYYQDSSVDVGLPPFKCVMSQRDQLQTGAPLGTCFCNNTAGGPDCGSPVVQTPQGALIGAGWGVSGSTLDPNGDVIFCNDDGVGFYEYEGRTLPWIKTLSVGITLISRSLQLTLDYGKIFRYEPTFGVNPFVNLTDGQYRTLEQATQRCLANGLALPAFVNGDELDDLAALSVTPAFFVDLYDTDTGWFWRQRGIQFASSSSVSTLSAPVVCTDPDWQDDCSAMNFNNVAYVPVSSPSSTSWTDGSMIYTAFPSPTPSPLTVRASVPAGVYQLVVFWAPRTPAPTSVLASPTCSAPTPYTAADGNRCTTFTCTLPTPAPVVVTVTNLDLAETQLFRNDDRLRLEVYPYPI